MRTLKFLSIALILIVGMILTFQGCQKETLSEPQNESKYVTKKLTFEDIKSKKELSKPIKLLEEVFDVNAKNKDLPNSFVIETDQIFEVSKDNRKTYSFNILNPTDSTSVFENFIIDVSDPNQTKYFIFKYKYKDDFNSGEFPFDISANGLSEYQISINNFQINLSKWELCFYEYTVISPRDDPAYDINMVEWWDCSGSGQGIDMGGDDSDSDSDNGDSDSSSTSNTSSNSGSSGSSSSSSSNDSSSSTTNPSNDTDNPHGPVGVNYDAIDNIASILTNLSDADLAYLETHPSFADKINQFLTQHPNSQPSNDFAQFAISNRGLVSSLGVIDGNLVLNLNNGASLTYIPNISANSPTFNSLDEIIENFDISNLNTSPSEMYVIDNTNPESKLAVFKWEFFTTTLNFYINQVVDPDGASNNFSNYSVSDLTTSLTGTTIAQQYENTTFNVTKKPNLNKATVDSYGTFSYFIFWEGIGTVYRQPLHFIIDLRMTDGMVLFGMRSYN